ncbi:hypothetical protein [Bacillus sp. FJAT-45350]|uniref:hypothetical protein n=1 Tax=Bacillus sp. FJAT-45350 TaxID=2011014 RepID=UPI000BB86863|nr:hypothetical protein [Bacillus sp. FJAT-45350]
MANGKVISQVYETEQVCSKCDSEDIIVMKKWRYFFLLSTLPMIVAIVASIWVHPIFLTMLVIIYFINNRAANKKTPMTVCRTCKQVSFGKKE